MVLGGFALAATVIRLCIPLVATRLHEARVVELAMLSTACLLALYPFAPNALSMGLLSMGLGLSLGSVQPMIMSTLHQITPSHRHGEALGLRAMAINASSVVMPLLFGAGGGLIGVAGMFWIVGGIVALGSQLTRRWTDD
jgi:MFS-type transporter involved in bile tolerance (Atg22 family)